MTFCRGFLATVAMTLVLTGCGGLLSPKKSKIFYLEPVAPAARVTVRGLPVGFDSIELPPGFDRKEIVVRQADQKLEVRGQEQWAATLEPTVLHVLAFDLAGRLPEGMVILPGAASPGAAGMRMIDVVFEELAPGPEKQVVLDARWILRESGRANVTTHERIVIDLPALDSANVAAGMSRALATLADHIATRLSGGA